MVMQGWLAATPQLLSSLRPSCILSATAAHYTPKGASTPGGHLACYPVMQHGSSAFLLFSPTAGDSVSREDHSPCTGLSDNRPPRTLPVSAAACLPPPLCSTNSRVLRPRRPPRPTASHLPLTLRIPPATAVHRTPGGALAPGGCLAGHPVMLCKGPASPPPPRRNWGPCPHRGSRGYLRRGGCGNGENWQVLNHELGVDEREKRKTRPRKR